MAFPLRNVCVAITDIPGCVPDGVTSCEAARAIGEARYASLYWPDGQYVVSQPPSLAVSWGPGVVFVAGQQVYLRPTPEPARSVLVAAMAYSISPTSGVSGIDVSAALQRLINYAQANSLPLELQTGARYYVATGLVFYQGKPTSSAPSLAVGIIGNNATILPAPGVTALTVYPQCALQNQGTGWQTADVEIRDLNIDGYFTTTPPSGPAGPATAVQIGVQGNAGICSQYGKIENLVVSNFYAGSTALLVQDFQHLLFTRCIFGSQTIYQEYVAGGFVGDLMFYSCQFVGSNAYPPIAITSSPTTTATGVATTYTQARGFHFVACDIYKTGTIMSATGNSNGTAQTGDIWWIGCAWDGPNANAGEEAVRWSCTGGASMFGIHMVNSYIVSYAGPGIYVQQTGTASNISSCKITGTHFNDIAPSASGDFNSIVLLQGAGGILIDGSTFSQISGETIATTLTSYFEFDGCPGPLQVRNSMASNPLGTAPNYGVTVNNCTNVLLDGNQFHVAPGGAAINQTGTNTGVTLGINVTIAN